MNTKHGSKHACRLLKVMREMRILLAGFHRQLLQQLPQTTVLVVLYLYRRAVVVMTIYSCFIMQVSELPSQSSFFDANKLSKVECEVDSIQTWKLMQAVIIDWERLLLPEWACRLLTSACVGFGPRCMRRLLQFSCWLKLSLSSECTNSSTLWCRISDCKMHNTEDKILW